jgi:hypothetical protein
VSSLAEIDAAAKALSLQEQRELLLSIASRLRAEPGALPEPRLFPQDVIRSWIDQDEADMRQFREKQ